MANRIEELLAAVAVVMVACNARSASTIERPAPVSLSADSEVELQLLNPEDVAWKQEDWGPTSALLEGTEPFTAPKTFTFLIKFPKNFRIPLHSHLSTERIAVLDGAVWFAYGDKENDSSAKLLSQGAVVLVPAGQPHYGFTTDSEATLMVHGVGPHNPPEQGMPPPAGSDLDMHLGAPIVSNAAELTYERAPNTLPPGAKMAVLEGRPPFDQRKEVTLRLQLPERYEIPVHRHAGTERLVVVSGTVMLGVGDRWDADSMKPLQEGAVVMMPRERSHYLFAKSAAVIELHAIGPFEPAGDRVRTVAFD